MKSPDETTRSIRWGPSFIEFIELTQHGLNCMASFKTIESCISDFAKSLKAAVVDSRMDDILVRLVSFSSCESLALRSYESFHRLHLTPAAPIPKIPMHLYGVRRAWRGGAASIAGTLPRDAEFRARSPRLEASSSGCVELRVLAIMSEAGVWICLESSWSDSLPVWSPASRLCWVCVQSVVPKGLRTLTLTSAKR